MDAAGAIALMDDSQELYREIAQAYLQELAELGPRLDTLLGQTQLAEATRTLHTFKGLSLTVGAKLLSEVCRQCELQLKSAQQQGLGLDAAGRAAMQDALQLALAQTQAALLETLAGFDAAAAPSQAPPSAGTDTAELVSDLHALRALLARSDMQALDRFDGLWQGHAQQRVLLQGLQQTVKSFNFSQAVVQCDELIRAFSNITR
ncbi:MAG: Hpt domain-containing protein [Rhodoferax sp.]|nr:Hpt domain-containing protein [Rhodoferax sp.]